MSYVTKQGMQDLAMYNNLVTSLITLTLILEEIDKISKVRDLEINNNIKQLELLEEELRIMTLRNRFLGRPSDSIEEEIDNIEEVKEWDFRSVRILQDLNFEKNDEVVDVVKIELQLQR